MTGKFVVIEGPDGGGKTTVINNLKAYYPDAVFTREPGGTDFAEGIRGLLLQTHPFPGADQIDAITQVLLFNAARRDHWVHKIKPALDEGKLVISDRWVDSTIVYQLSHHAFPEFDLYERGVKSFAHLFHLTNRIEQPMGLRILDMHRTAGLPTPNLTLFISPDEHMRAEHRRNGRDNTTYERNEQFQQFVQTNYDKWMGMVAAIKANYGDGFHNKLQHFVKDGQYHHVTNEYNRLSETMDNVQKHINNIRKHTMKVEVTHVA